ncbi:MAG TPA: DUF4345 domain-containing protein [Steroidobacteraceae bacterium]|nr:DUF4345 domain-containing protein [Steroidobacteraceae bacterium]
MRPFQVFLRIVACVIFMVGGLHLTLGLGAEVLLGAIVPLEAINDPALDSQNRFYGVAFTLYGVLLILCASDVLKYASVLRCVVWVFFAAGAARFVSVAIHGMAPPLVLLLMGSELIAPLLLLWLAKVERQARI